jgi:hypothetical protein
MVVMLIFSLHFSLKVTLKKEIGSRHMKFDMEIDYSRTYIIRMKYRL